MDGVDVYATYGAFVVQDGYKGLVQWPALKEPDSNDWAEEDGIEVDLSAPVLDSKEVRLEMAFLGDDGYHGFVEALLLTTWHDFDFREIGRACWLRLVSQSGLSRVQGLSKCTFRFSDDEPLRGYTYQPPRLSDVLRIEFELSTGNLYEVTGTREPVPGQYAVDGRDLAEYGARVLKGALPTVTALPEVKGALEIESRYLPGTSYDGGGIVRLSDRSITLPLLMRAETLGGLWRNYDALLYDLVRPGEHRLSFRGESHGIEHLVYYESCSVDRFYATDIWLEFRIGLHVTNWGRPFGIAGIALEDGRDLALEDGRRIIMESYND